MSDTIRFKNTSDHKVNLAAVGLPTVAPGGEIDVPLALCAPGRADGGGRKKSPIECVAPQMQPADPADLELWQGVPAPLPLISKIVSVNNNKPPVEPAGVKALRDGLAAKKAQEAKATAPANDSKPSEGKKG